MIVVSNMKQIPNFFTILNLICGCIAIVLILQTGQGIAVFDNGSISELVLPERIWQGSLFIFAAAVIDFLDGFFAKLLKAQSALGEQLDSLSDAVSFGVAPGMILYQLLRISYAQEENGLNVTILALLPAFIFTAAVVWRLAKFNISTDQYTSFRGVPSPAGGLLVASFPLIIWYQYFNIHALFINKWFLYGVIIIVSWLMLNNRKFMALKFRDYSFSNNALKYLLVFASLIALIFLKWLAVPVIFLLYLIFSFFAKENPLTVSHKDGYHPDL
jgi:CDP-diacylglycerol--serine O-phosphatidyltransferase